MRKYGVGISVIVFVSLLVGPTLISAQTGSKSGPSTDNQSHVYDRYPHAKTRGSLRFALTDKWSTTELTFQFNNCPTLVDCDEAQASIRQAFDDWAAVSALTFTEVESGADIEIAWAGEEEDEDMGPDGDTLGFAYSPGDGGDLFLNDNIEWEFGTGTDDDLYMTAAHEIGHALGLEHSSDPAALMYPTGTDETTGIAEDDIQGIQALYGGNDGNAPTLNADDTPMNASSDESDDSETDAMEGTLDNSTPYELWEIDAEEGETLSITMTAVDGDLLPHLGILTEDEDTVIEESSDDSETEASVNVTFPSAGTYLIMATREDDKDGTSEGAYTLTVEEASSEMTQSNDHSSATTVEMANFTGVDVCEIYVSPADGEDWGDDLLAGESLADGESINAEFEPGSYDSLVVTCDDSEIEEYGLSLDDGSSIEIYEDAITVYP